MLVAAGGVPGEVSSCRKNDSLPLGSAGVSDKPDSYSTDCVNWRI